MIPPPRHDPEALFMAMCDIRNCCISIGRRRTDDPTIREALRKLDCLAGEMHLEIETCEPQSPLVTP
jgi:hypothetical protein